MAARKQARLRPVDAATRRLMELAARGVPARRIAREVEVIVDEWLAAPDAEPSDAKGWLSELREEIATGVADAEEQLSYVDAGEAAAAKQAGLTLAALQASHEAVERASAQL
ncbi:MAG: hypothetical protein NTZ14_19540 [Hyphomicrobiales bacterium]|jgi:hypothetical protein|nr:hypothetical protein [Hyphomicrobiales bacterium]